MRGCTARCLMMERTYSHFSTLYSQLYYVVESILDELHLLSTVLLLVFCPCVCCAGSPSEEGCDITVSEDIPFISLRRHPQTIYALPLQSSTML